MHLRRDQVVIDGINRILRDQFVAEQSRLLARAFGGEAAQQDHQRLGGAAIGLAMGQQRNWPRPVVISSLPSPRGIPILAVESRGAVAAELKGVERRLARFVREPALEV